MQNNPKKYCLDTNFFIEGWNKYYSPDFCSSYWEVIDELAKKGIVFIPSEVKKEIDKGDDKLKNWLKDKEYFVRPITKKVESCLKEIYSRNHKHKYLANNVKNRSLADPWVIAHAMAENATVVTKEYLSNSPNPQKIRVPDVCENMNVPWTDDFGFIKAVNIKFDCKIIPPTLSHNG